MPVVLDIPRFGNRLSLLLVAGFFALTIALGIDMRDIGYHVIASMEVLAVGFLFYSRVFGA